MAKNFENKKYKKKMSESIIHLRTDQENKNNNKNKKTETENECLFFAVNISRRIHQG